MKKTQKSMQIEKEHKEPWDISPTNLTIKEKREWIVAEASQQQSSLTRFTKQNNQPI